MNQPTALTIAQLENVYDNLAQAIDQAKNHAGGDRAELFLTKLCLLLANALGDGPEADLRFTELVQKSLLNL